MTWSIPSFPCQPRDEMSFALVDDAFLSRFDQGPLRTFERPDTYVRGAVYDSAGQLCEASQKIGVRGYPRVPADPRSVRVNPKAPLAEGTWLYGGHWIQHFGHFIIETLTTLWPERSDLVGPSLDGLVFHKYQNKPVAHEDWMLRLLELVGYAGLPIRVVGYERALRVERLHLPSRSIVADGWGHPEARAVWERMAAPFVGSTTFPDRVYLSRTDFNAARRISQPSRARSSLERDQAKDRAFKAAGFAVIAPETLSIDEQLALVANATVIAGGSGSALHLTAFAPRGTHVIEIGDERNPAAAIGLQRVIDRLGEHPHTFVRGDLQVAALEQQLHAVVESLPSPLRNPLGSAVAG